MPQAGAWVSAFFEWCKGSWTEKRRHLLTGAERPVTSTDELEEAAGALHAYDHALEMLAVASEPLTPGMVTFMMFYEALYTWREDARKRYKRKERFYFWNNAAQTISECINEVEGEMRRRRNLRGLVHDKRELELGVALPPAHILQYAMRATNDTLCCKCGTTEVPGFAFSRIGRYWRVLDTIPLFAHENKFCAVCHDAMVVKGIGVMTQNTEMGPLWKEKG